MTRFSGMLSMLMDRPVLDLTGLTGSYDFTLKIQSEQPGPEGKAALAEWFSSAIFSEIEKQLGLRLEADKGPVDYLIVDHVEKPAAN
jgi:bla regulator protein BlaR1